MWKLRVGVGETDGGLGWRVVVVWQWVRKLLLGCMSLLRSLVLPKLWLLLKKLFRCSLLLLVLLLS